MVPLRSFFEYDNPLKNFIYYRKLWDFERLYQREMDFKFEKKHDTQGGQSPPLNVLAAVLDTLRLPEVPVYTNLP